MVDNVKNETFILISPKKFVICVNSGLDKKIYERKFLVKENFNKIDFKKLEYFLDENIFKIEKKLKDFIKRTSIILDMDIFFQIEIGMKKKKL